MHIDVNDKEHYVPLNQVYIGLQATDTISGIADDIGRDHPDIQLFYTHCRNFLIETVKQILSRFDDVDKFNFLSFLTPASAYVLSPSSLSHMYRKLPYLKDVADMNQAEKEWRHHALSPNLNIDKTFQEYWTVVFSERNQAHEKVNPNLTKLVATVLSLPFSNASVERVFSQLKIIKDDRRAALKQESLLALLCTKFSFLKEIIQFNLLIHHQIPLYNKFN